MLVDSGYVPRILWRIISWNVQNHSSFGISGQTCRQKVSKWCIFIHEQFSQCRPSFTNACF